MPAYATTPSRHNPRKIVRVIYDQPGYPDYPPAKKRTPVRDRVLDAD